MLSLLSQSVVTLALGWSLGAPVVGGSLVGLEAGSTYLAKVAAIAQLSEDELAVRVSQDLTSLGSMSVGAPNNGRLVGGVRMESSPYFEVVSKQGPYGTEETLRYLEAAARKVHAEFPGSPPLHVGDISREKGGHMSPHKSHQSGRDVDLGFFYRDDHKWYRRGTAQNLDLPRTWALLRAIVTETDVEMVLLDRSISSLLEKYAAEHGESATWLQQIFRGDASRPAIVRHARGHGTHLHIRFYNPVAETLAQRAYPFLADAGYVPPLTSYAQYRAKKGDTLGKIARTQGSSVKAIQAANGLRSSAIVAGRTYRIPRAPGVRSPERALVFPPRRLPG